MGYHTLSAVGVEHFRTLGDEGVESFISFKSDGTLLIVAPRQSVQRTFEVASVGTVAKDYLCEASWTVVGRGDWYDSPLSHERDQVRDQCQVFREFPLKARIIPGLRTLVIVGNIARKEVVDKDTIAIESSKMPKVLEFLQTALEYHTLFSVTTEREGCRV